MMAAIPLTLSWGQVETDKWPLALARLGGQAQAVPGVRRGRESFDGFRQIAKKKKSVMSDGGVRWLVFNQKATQWATEHKIKPSNTPVEYEYEPLDELIATPPFFDFLFYSVETDRYLASRPVR